MVDTTFEELAKSLMRLSENIVSTADDTMKSCILHIGIELIARTPKDTGRASINWIAVIDSDTNIELPYPTTNKSQNEWLDFYLREEGGGSEYWAERVKIRNEVKHSAVLQAEADLVGKVNEFYAGKNRFIAIVNNLDYIELLAYYDHAKRAMPLAPAGHIVDDNMAENDYFMWLSKADNFFKGV